ncbi:uncharacterized protein LOC108653931 isoform X10 [Drosophila navojoa]|uniref:uncharacterized protein LOC108653931 isoform X10 n=1 Tax=Drosophila navojoa TaxID=7232 RepID=UPI000846B190|nr:uncharacterized protein LOC108653931 isoform X10 [Drosophila navojoa]
MEVGPVFYFVALLLVGFLSYALLQCTIIWIIRCCCPAGNQNSNRRRNRQNTVELGRQHSRYGDIFYIEPNSQEAARIREQLEKDEKDLPSYEEVMRMCNLTTPTAAVAPPPTQPPMMESNAIGIAALPAPPYSEIDPHRSVTTPPPPIATGTTVNTSEPSPSTSRAAQITT